MKSSVIVFPGSNCDRDIAVALENLQFKNTMVWHKETNLPKSDLIVIPGGFSYGDYLRSGAIAAKSNILNDVIKAANDGCLVLGICNGFQTLVRMGILPGAEQSGALGHNDSGVFDCRWIEMAPTSDKCIWTQHLTENIACPIAHGEGRFTSTDSTLNQLIENDQVALRYVNGNPNGSIYDIAGICDDSGVVLGLMPHPENHVVARQHPKFHRGVSGGMGGIAEEL